MLPLEKDQKQWFSQMPVMSIRYVLALHCALQLFSGVSTASHEGCSSLSYHSSSFSICVTWMRPETSTDTMGDRKIMLMIPISWLNCLFKFCCGPANTQCCYFYLHSQWPVCCLLYIEIVLLWALAYYLILSLRRILEGFSMMKLGEQYFCTLLVKLWVPETHKLFGPGARLLAMLGHVPWFCWACVALPARKWGDVKNCSQSPDCFHPFLMPRIARKPNSIYRDWWAQEAWCPNNWAFVG